MLGKKYHLLGQGLMGAGIATLYLSVFAGANRYHLLGQLSAFPMMALITAAAGCMAVRYRSLLVAVLGILGGYGTPIMLSTGEPNFVGLFSYLLILGSACRESASNAIAPARMAQFRRELLVVLPGHAAIRAAAFWRRDAFFGGVLRVVFHGRVHLQRNEPVKSTLLELLGLWTNAGIFFCRQLSPGAANVREAGRGDRDPGMTSFFVGHVYVFLQRKVRDRELLLSFTARHPSS